MEKKDIEELMMMEFGELMYAWGSPLGTTVSLLEDYEDYFERNSAEYYHYLSSLCRKAVKPRGLPRGI